MGKITIDSEAFYSLIEEVVERVRDKEEIKQDKWISGREAMHKMRITSPTTLAMLRNKGKIRYTQPEKKIILYDNDSIDEYLEKHAKDTF